MRNVPFIIITIWITMINQCQSVYYFANLNFKYSYTKGYRSNFTQIKELDVNKLKIVELYANNTLILTSLDQLSPYQKTYFNSTDPNSFYYNQQLIGYSFDRWDTWEIHFLIQTGIIISHYPYYDYQYNRLDVSSIEISINSLLKNTNQTFYIFNPTNQTVLINRIFRQQQLNMNLIQQNALNYSLNLTNFQLIPNPIITSITGQEIKATVCKTTYNFKEYIAVWNSSTYIQLYECDYFQCTLNGTINPNLGNTSWIGQSISFSYQCDRLLVQYDNAEYPSVYNLSGYRKAFYPVLQQIIDFKPLAYSINQAILLFPNGSFIIFSVRNNTFMKQYNSFGLPTEFSRYTWSPRRIIMNYQNRIDVYKLQCWDLMYFYWWRGQCTNCSNTCASCDQSWGDCLTCIPGYQINPYNTMECIPIPLSNSSIVVTPPPIQPNTTIPINNNTNNTDISNTTSNTTNNQSIQNSTQDQHPQDNYGAYYYYEIKSAKGLIKGFQIIGQFIGILFNILQVLPLAWLFLNFMNFWSICSFYVFLQVQIPNYLKLILKIIYDKINTPIIDTDEIAHLLYSQQEKLPQLSDQYGVSSSFIHNNLQSFIIFLFSISIAKLCILIFSKFPKKSWFHINLSKNMDFLQITTSQFISTASTYFLPFILIMKMSNRFTFKQIPNLVLHISLIGFSLIFPFLNFNKQNKKRSLKYKSVEKEKEKIQSFKENKRQTVETLEWIFDCNCNTIIPLLCVFQQPILYLIVGILFFAYGVRLAYYSQSFKANYVILAVYRLLFHLSFTIISVFGQFSIPIKHNGAMICALLLFIGAIHQILTLFFQVSYFILSNIKIYYQKIKRIKDKPQIETQKIKQKQKNTIEIKNKMKLKIQKISQNQISLQQERNYLKKISKPITFKPKKTKNSIHNSQLLQKNNHHHKSDSISTDYNSKSIQNPKTYFDPSKKKNQIERKRLNPKSFIEHKVRISNILQKINHTNKPSINNKVLQILNFD